MRRNETKKSEWLASSKRTKSELHTSKPRIESYCYEEQRGKAQYLETAKYELDTQ